MNIIDEVKLNDDLYPLILSTPNSNSYQVNSAKKNNFIDEWHRKLSHFIRGNKERGLRIEYRWLNGRRPIGFI